ncbi:aminoglycoside phosphotransferase family protein [Streptomyces sp. NPDC088197]|uniref:aminoglycoside phosphotransferase family protein n=1 Tax=unclassified Streptomyces TaxID=2593676 RepID=UPI0036E0B4A4
MGVLTTGREQSLAAAWDTVRQDATRFGERLTGHHNSNYVIDLAPGMAERLRFEAHTPVKVRVPLDGSLKVVERVWPDEGEILNALQRTAVVENTPRHYVGLGGFSVHEYVPGQALAEVCAPGKPVDPFVVDAIVGQMAGFTRVSAADLPPLPAGWAADGDSNAFLRARADFAEHDVRAANWADFAPLFAALEVPANALRWFRDRMPPLRRRPFALLHGDLHRHNLIVRADGGLTVVDWELAMWGDPLHDLAIHLVRMRYPADQRPEVIERWRRAVLRVHPEAAAGLERDLPVYTAYERAQSLFADTMRVALALDAHPGPGMVGAGVSRVRAALHLAAVPLRLRRVATRTEVERALVDWVRKRQRDGVRVPPLRDDIAEAA